jgi:uncharacterized protein YecE (DUF72 family)
MSHWYLGTIGFSYKEWVGAFYPTGTAQRDYLSYYCQVFNSVELDTTFHSIPQRTTVQSWASSTPSEFKFCLKTPRVITHDLGLKATEGLMNEFYDSIYPLIDKIGPILIQLPPKYSQDNYSVLSDFLDTLSNTYRYAVEFRHPSWYNNRTTQLLSKHHVCWVTIDYPNLPKQINVTTDFLYFRWIGINGKYQIHSYERMDKTTQLKWWLQVIHPFLDQTQRLYGFFNNDYAGFAAGTCKRFKLFAGLNDNKQNIPYQEMLF